MENVIEVIEKEIQRLEAELSEFKRALNHLTEKPSTTGLVGKACTRYKFYIDDVLCDKEALNYLKQFTIDNIVAEKLLKKLTLSNVVDEYISEHKIQSKFDIFGNCNKMKNEWDGEIYSGLNWSKSSQGHIFWKDILGKK